MTLIEFDGEYEVTIDPSGLTTGSEHTLILESYNYLSSDRQALMTDTITIKVPCQPVVQADIDPYISEVGKTLVIEVQKGQEPIQTVSYSDIFDLVKKAFLLDVNEKESCIVGVKTSLEDSSINFIFFDKDSELISVIVEE